MVRQTVFIGWFAACAVLFVTDELRAQPTETDSPPRIPGFRVTSYEPNSPTPPVRNQSSSLEVPLETPTPLRLPPTTDHSSLSRVRTMLTETPPEKESSKKITIQTDSAPAERIGSPLGDNQPRRITVSSEPPIPGTSVFGTPLVGEPVKNPAPRAEEKKEENPFSVVLKYKQGDEHFLNWETANKDWKFYVGGRLQFDVIFMHAGNRVQDGAGGVGDIRDAVSFRRARFDLGGTLYGNISYLMEFDFINTTNVERTGAPLSINTPVPTDAWFNFALPWVGNMRIGNQKPMIGFEHLTSSRFLNFLERSLPFDAFIENGNNGFTPGINFFDTAMDDRLFWALGVFKNTQSIFGWNVGDGEYDVTGRLAVLPVYEQEGRFLIHAGVGFSHRDLDDGQVRFRARTMERNGPAVLHTTVTDARMIGDGEDLIVPEFVAVLGPLSLQAEYFGAWVRNAITPVTGAGTRTNHGTVYFQGGSVEAHYFLTGEYRAFDRKRFAFTRVTPHYNWKPSSRDGDCEGGGIGAWQLALRYTWIDLNDKGIRGNQYRDFTFGLNWFLNPYMKWQWNYSVGYRDATETSSGYIHGFGTRIAVDF